MIVKLKTLYLDGSGTYNYVWILPNIIDAYFVGDPTNKISYSFQPEIKIVNYPLNVTLQVYDVINGLSYEKDYTIEDESSSSSIIESSSSVEESSSSSVADEYYLYVSCVGGASGNLVDLNGLLITDTPYGPSLIAVNYPLVLEAVSAVDWTFVEWQYYNDDTALWETLSTDIIYFTNMPSNNLFIRGYFELNEESSSSSIEESSSSSTSESSSSEIAESSSSCESVDCFAGENATIDAGESYNLSDSTSNNYTSLEWSVVDGTGVFDDTTILHSTFTPSLADELQGFVHLKLTAQGCDGPVDDIMILTITPL